MEVVFGVRHFDSDSEIFLFKDEEKAKEFTKTYNGLEDGGYYYHKIKLYDDVEMVATFFVSVETDNDTGEDVFDADFRGVFVGPPSEGSVVLGAFQLSGYVDVPIINGVDMKKMAIKKFMEAVNAYKDN